MVGKNTGETISTKVELELDTTEQIEKIFAGNDNTESIQLCDGKVELKLVSTGNSLAFAGLLTAELVLTFSIGVASGVIANAIYDAIRFGVKKIEINGRRTRVTKESIAKTLEAIKEMELSAKYKRNNKGKKTKLD